MKMLSNFLDWEKIFRQPRYAGGHEEVMRVLFRGAIVLAEWVERDYQGTEAFAYLLPNTEEYGELADKIVILTDYFGSCSGCDSWEDASDKDVKALCMQLANNAHIFSSIKTAIQFLEVEVPGEATLYDCQAAIHLIEPLRKLLAAELSEKIRRIS